MIRLCGLIKFIPVPFKCKNVCVFGLIGYNPSGKLKPSKKKKILQSH